MKVAIKIISAIERFIKIVSILDGILIVALVLMICVDIIMRILGTNIPGSVEMTTMSVPVIVFLGVGYTALQEMHVRVDVIKRWPNMDRVTNLICIVFIAMIGCFCATQAMQVYRIGTTSSVLYIPRWPFVMVTAFGMFMVALAMTLNETKAYIKLYLDRKQKRMDS